MPAWSDFSLETWYIRPDILGHAVKNTLFWLGLVVVATSAVTVAAGIRRRLEFRAFVGSTFLIAGILGTGAPPFFRDALFNASAGEFRNGLRRCVKSWNPNGGSCLVAGRLHHGCFLLCLYLSSLCRQGELYPRQSGLLLNHAARECGRR